MEMPNRTGVSELGDRELILFDFLFDATAPRPMLENEKLAIHHNTGYSHEFEKEELNSILSRFSEKGLLFTQHQNYWGEVVPYYGLTLAGGKLWESERKPIWERYIDESQAAENGENIWATTISSYSKECLLACVKYYLEIGFLGEPISNLTYTQSNPESLIYWKDPGIVYECMFKAKDEHNQKVDWNEYERNRVWWRHISELQKYIA